jgi:hypothetical protein
VPASPLLLDPLLASPLLLLLALEPPVLALPELDPFEAPAPVLEVLLPHAAAPTRLDAQTRERMTGWFEMCMTKLLFTKSCSKCVPLYLKGRTPGESFRGGYARRSPPDRSGGENSFG